MIKIFRSYIFLPLLSFVTAICSPIAKADETGFIIGVGAYYAEVDDDLHSNDLGWGGVNNPADAKIFFDDKSYGYHLDIAWRFNKWLAVDAGYWDLGEFKSGRVEGVEGKVPLEFSAFSLGGIASVPVWMFDLYGRGGSLFWDVDSSGYNNSGTDIYYGAGVSLSVFNIFDLYLEALRFEVDTPINQLGLGVRYTF